MTLMLSRKSNVLNMFLFSVWTIEGKFFCSKGDRSFGQFDCRWSTLRFIYKGGSRKTSHYRIFSVKSSRLWLGLTSNLLMPLWNSKKFINPFRPIHRANEYPRFILSWLHCANMCVYIALNTWSEKKIKPTPNSIVKYSRDFSFLKYSICNLCIGENKKKKTSRCIMKFFEKRIISEWNQHQLN